MTDSVRTEIVYFDEIDDSLLNEEFIGFGGWSPELTGAVRSCTRWRRDGVEMPYADAAMAPE